MIGDIMTSLQCVFKRLRSPATGLFVQPDNKENIITPHYWAFAREIIRGWLMDSPHKGPILWKEFPGGVIMMLSLRWRHNGCDGVSNLRRLGRLLNRFFFRFRWKKTSKLRVTGLCEGNSQVTGEFPAQRASNAESISNWWRLHGFEFM